MQGMEWLFNTAIGKPVDQVDLSTTVEFDEQYAEARKEIDSLLAEYKEIEVKDNGSSESD
jgi:hypothetical protein